MIRFLRSIKNLECTTLLISELTKPGAYSLEAFLVHGVLMMHNFMNGSTMSRGIQIVKMRGTKHDCDIRSMSIGSAGLTIEGKLAHS